MTIDELLRCFPDARRNGSGWTARCPAHEDRHPSLSIGLAEDRRILLHCHAGCPVEAILAAANLKIADLMPTSDRPRRRQASRLNIVATYPYLDETGNLLYEVLRLNPKGFRQRRPDGQGGWLWNLSGARRVLYHLPELLKADSGQWVFVVEGEKDVDSLRAIGLTATCNSGGASKWRHTEDDVLTGRKVAILPDRDEPGEKHAIDVANRLQPKAAQVRIVRLPGESKDASDFIEARRRENRTDQEIYQEILTAIETTSDFRPGQQDGDRASQWADQFIAQRIAPAWHRDGKTLFSAVLNREIPVNQLWLQLIDEDLEQLLRTVEGRSNPAYRSLLALGRDAILMAAARAVNRLPEAADASRDLTVRADELLDKLAIFVIKPRTFRTDTGGLVTESYLAWLLALEQNVGKWIQCRADPVFGRFDDRQPRLAIQAAALAGELRYSSVRRLVRDVRSCGLGQDTSIKCALKTWRVIELAQVVLDSVARLEE